MPGLTFSRRSLVLASGAVMATGATGFLVPARAKWCGPHRIHARRVQQLPSRRAHR